MPSLIDWPARFCMAGLQYAHLLGRDRNRAKTTAPTTQSAKLWQSLGSCSRAIALPSPLEWLHPAIDATRHDRNQR
ncbi:hypothetical protein [Xanthomonas pisi]|nr:hypothetical protein [Xanthomonas pisi]